MAQNQDNDNPTKLDRMGIWISGLCAVHCLALPVILPLLPLLGSTFFAQLWFERTILTISMLIGGVALTSGALRYHGQYYPLVLLFTGGGIYWFKDIFGHEFEPFTIAVGALLIISGHVINMRLCRHCLCCRNSVFSTHATNK
ncbi:MerC domain-containing protein [Alteromonas sp. 14N.309.X.WAT.G.H12]|uniref:MerC domain-containing protein n=1 Tax=Alteromonas sp. 14N.309.X.WAT.G.H12 TaxID=3120824 RepID=UPI002FD06151